MTTVRARIYAGGLAATVASLLLIASGCGSDDSQGSSADEENHIKQVFDRWQASFIAGDGDEVCSLLTTSAKQELLAAKGSAPGASAGASCEETVRAITRESNRAGLDQESSRAVSVQIKGDTAIAMVSDAGRKAQPVKFVKQDGEWKLPSVGLDSR
ncbi:MAG TPA: hypothetical protein VEX36_07945 [Thermoleophilaceae bacterium]|nr:hypothetical protein [Thermoleophilaceae bacterium]